MLQESGKSDVSVVSAARNNQPVVCLPAARRQRASNDLQGRQCHTAVFTGLDIIRTEFVLSLYSVQAAHVAE